MHYVCCVNAPISQVTPDGLRSGFFIVLGAMLFGALVGQGVPFMVLGALVAECVLRVSVNKDESDPIERLAYHSGQFPMVFFLLAVAGISTMLLAAFGAPHPLPAVAGILVIAVVIPAWLLVYYRRASRSA